MEMLKAYSRQSLLMILLVMALLLLLVDGAFYWGVERMFSQLTISGTVGGGAEVVDLLERVTTLETMLKRYFVPVSSVCFASAAFLLWLYLRFQVSGLIKKLSADGKPAKKKSAEQPRVDHRKLRTRNERMFLHLLTLFQREGRLVDFFSEDLNLYEDAQIGAAVRSIHESCKKSLNKYLRLQSVIDRNEGEEVTIETGFDPDAIKLTGNVSGDPPFSGILRHRGWRTTNIDLPTLSDTGDSKIIAPAEVEMK